MIADTFSVPEKTVTVFARALKEAGLMTTGARGINAPDMTACDAARMTISLLACDGPSQAVERVQRFGEIRYFPEHRPSAVWREVIKSQEFASIFPVETLEEVLTFIYSAPLLMPSDEAWRWFSDNRFSLRVMPFDVRAELETWVWDGPKIVGERIIPFKGDRNDPRYERIGRGIHVERIIPPASISLIATHMWAAAQKGEA